MKSDKSPSNCRNNQDYWQTAENDLYQEDTSSEDTFKWSRDLSANLTYGGFQEVNKKRCLDSTFIETYLKPSL